MSLGLALLARNTRTVGRSSSWGGAPRTVAPPAAASLPPDPLVPLPLPPTGSRVLVTAERDPAAPVGSDFAATTDVTMSLSSLPTFSPAWSQPGLQSTQSSSPSSPGIASTLSPVFAVPSPSSKPKRPSAGARPRALAVAKPRYTRSQLLGKSAEQIGRWLPSLDSESAASLLLPVAVPAPIPAPTPVPVEQVVKEERAPTPLQATPVDLDELFGADHEDEDGEEERTRPIRRPVTAPSRSAVATALPIPFAQPRPLSSTLAALPTHSHTPTSSSHGGSSGGSSPAHTPTHAVGRRPVTLAAALAAREATLAAAAQALPRSSAAGAGARGASSWSALLDDSNTTSISGDSDDESSEDTDSECVGHVPPPAAVLGHASIRAVCAAASPSSPDEDDEDAQWAAEYRRGLLAVTSSSDRSASDADATFGPGPGPGPGPAATTAQAASTRHRVPLSVEARAARRQRQQDRQRLKVRAESSAASTALVVAAVRWHRERCPTPPPQSQLASRRSQAAADFDSSTSDSDSPSGSASPPPPWEQPEAPPPPPVLLNNRVQPACGPVTGVSPSADMLHESHPVARSVPSPPLPIAASTTIAPAPAASAMPLPIIAPPAGIPAADAASVGGKRKSDVFQPLAMPPPKARAPAQSSTAAAGSRTLFQAAPEPVRAECHFYLAGTCTKGAACAFAHTGMTRFDFELCRFGRGCNRGSACPYQHDPQKVPCVAFHTPRGCSLQVCPASHAPLAPAVVRRLHEWATARAAATASPAERAAAQVAATLGAVFVPGLLAPPADHVPADRSLLPPGGTCLSWTDLVRTASAVPAPAGYRYPPTSTAVPVAQAHGLFAFLHVRRVPAPTSMHNGAACRPDEFAFLQSSSCC